MKITITSKEVKVTDAIKELNDKESITIIVNPQLVDNLNKLIPEFKKEFSKMI